MFPQESAYRGELVIKGPSEAQCQSIWKGASVFQFYGPCISYILLVFFKCMLEAEDIGNGTPQGLFLLLFVLRMIRRHSAKISKIYGQFECITLQVSLVSLGGRLQMR